MAISKVRRGAALAKVGFPTANSIRVDSTSEVLVFGTGASGTTEKTAVDTSSTQTLTGKTLTSPVITGATITGGTVQAVETVITGDGAITIAPGVVTLTKGSAAAITLAAPTAGQAGTIITITNGSAFAHVITATGLLQDGITGGAKNTATFGAFVGATITLIASQLKWNVKSLNVVTVAA